MNNRQIFWSIKHLPPNARAMADKRYHLINSINVDRLIPSDSIAYWDKLIAREERKRRQAYRTLIASFFVLFFFALTANYAAAFVGYLLYRWVRNRFLSDELLSDINGFLPDYYQKSRKQQDFESNRQLILQNARSIQQELESRPKGFLFRFSDLLEDRRFQCEGVSDDKIWHYMSLSHNQRGSEIPLEHYQAIVAGLQDCIESPKIDIDQQVLIDSAKLLREVEDGHSLLKLQDTAKVMLKEWAFSSKVLAKHQVLISNVDEVEAALQYTIGWYGLAAERLLNCVVNYKNAIVAETEEISSSRVALQHALDQFVTEGVPGDSPLIGEFK